MFHMTLLTTVQEPRTLVIPEWTLADRLRKSRELTGLGQHDFAELSGISRASVVNYETGNRVPKGLYLRAWAEATGVPAKWLASGDTSRTNENTPTVNGEGDSLPRLDSNQQPAGLLRASMVTIPGTAHEFLTVCAIADDLAEILRACEPVG